MFWYDHGHPAADQIGHQRGQPIALAFRPAEFDRHVAALDEAGLAQALAERRNLLGGGRRHLAVEIPDHRHCRLLRPRRERPRRRPAAEEGDELASTPGLPPIQ